MLPEQKRLGAYYTQEDIAAYISGNTIIPFILDAVEQKCPAAFVSDGPVWSLLRENPDQYIYDALRKGCAFPLPPEIEAGIQDMAHRATWNKLAPEEYALSLETWREVVARRQRYGELRAKLGNGEICTVHGLITCNLDVRAFARDIVTRCERVDLLGVFYESMEHMTILDPTCGSGAFLLAALDVLEPLYLACLARMQSMVERNALPDEVHLPVSTWIGYFREIMSQVEQYSNRRSFIFQVLLAQNLYGVNIMPEAAKSCRAALSLRLASQIEDLADLETLPGIDFNIRIGNALVGFITSDELVKPVNPSRTWLDNCLAAEYGLEQSREQADYAEKLARWQASHRPFHWCIEFREAMQNGGFDVIIGNPPYVTYSKVRDTYQNIIILRDPCL